MVLEIQVEIQNSLTSNLFMMKRDYCITDQRQCISCKFIRNFQNTNKKKIANL